MAWQNVTNATKLMTVEFMKTENHVKLPNIDVVFAATSACKRVSHVLTLCDSKKSAAYYLQHVCIKLTAKCPLQYRLVAGTSYLDPLVILNETQSMSQVTTALEVSIEFEKKKNEPNLYRVLQTLSNENMVRWTVSKKGSVRSML